MALRNWADIWGDVWGDIWASDSDPPTFAGTIANISVTQNTGTHSYDLGDYFSGATSYSISPAVETGWSFNTTTGELEIDTDALGTFGPFVVTATNVAGTADSNAFTVMVVAAARGGIPKKKRRKRYYVEIDGQTFDVESYAEAEQLLQRAKRTAQAVAEQATERSAKRVRRGKQAVLIEQPKISTPFTEIASLVDEYREDIEAIYRQIAIDAELREALRLKLLEQDEEEAIFVLLH